MKIVDGIVYMIKGDTESLTIAIKDAANQNYILQAGDTLTLTLRHNTGDKEAAVSITSSTGTIPINHSDTANIEVGQYSADIQLNKANGEVHTVWPTWDVEEDAKKIKSDTNWKNWWIMPEVTR